MFAALLTSCLLGAAASGPIDVVVSRRIDVQEARAELLARDLSRALTVRGIPQVRPPEQTLLRVYELRLKPPVSCEARRACVAKLGAQLGARMIVSIDVGVVAARLAVTVEAVDPLDGARLAQRTFTAKSAGDEPAVAGELETFAAQVAFADESRRQGALPADAPAATSRLTPPATDASPEASSAALVASQRSTPPAAVAAAGGAVAGGVAAAGFALWGLSADLSLQAARFDSPAGPASRLTRPDAEARAQAANTRYAIGAGCAVGSAALVAIAWHLWGSESE